MSKAVAATVQPVAQRTRNENSKRCCEGSRRGRRLAMPSAIEAMNQTGTTATRPSRAYTVPIQYRVRGSHMVCALSSQ